MSSGRFVKGTAIAFGSSAIRLLIGIGTSVVLARTLGPEGWGIYTLATLLPLLIVTLGNFGIEASTIYYVARGEYCRQEILGTNILLSLFVSAIGVLTGLVVVMFFREEFFPGVASIYLLPALAIIPLDVFFLNIGHILLGAQRIKEFNYIQIAQSALFLGITATVLLGLKAGVTAAIFARLLTWSIANILVLRSVREVAGGIVFTPNILYIKKAITYGIQAHLAYIFVYLNYRVDIFLVNWFLDPAAVGLYTVGVALVEQLWMVSQAASLILFPMVAAETEEMGRKEFPSLVARTVLLITALGALVLSLLSHWIVLLLYSEAYLPAVNALQALLAGIVALSAGRVLMNYIAGRGYPGLNIYTGVAAVVTNVVLNLLWIPNYGIVGAAWASTVSYTVSFLGSLFFFCRLSGDHWTRVVLPQTGDGTMYWKAGKALYQWAWTKARTAL